MIKKLKYLLVSVFSIVLLSEIYCADQGQEKDQLSCYNLDIKLAKFNESLDKRISNNEQKIKDHTQEIKDHTQEINDTNNKLDNVVSNLNTLIAEFNKFIENVPNLNVLVPIGAIIEYSGANLPPANWLECNGQAVSRTDYNLLYRVIDVTYGVGDGHTTFNVPDRRGYVAVGIGSNGTTGRVTGATAHEIGLGKTFGEEMHRLTVNELPTLQFTVNASSFHKRGHDAAQVGNGRGIPRDDDINSNTIGGNQHHNNMQPSIFMKFYIRAS